MRQRAVGARAAARRRAKEGPQWRLCHTTACAVCFGLHWRDSRRGPIEWEQLPSIESGAKRSEGHHEPERGRLDVNTIPLGSSRVHGGCGHHEERTRLGANAFWDKYEMNPADPLGEMRRRAAAR